MAVQEIEEASPMKSPVSIKIDLSTDTLALVDQLRGDTSRSDFIESRLKRLCQAEKLTRKTWSALRGDAKK